MRTLFKASWVNASFIHFAIDPRLLQAHVPLPLDLLDGKAIVSLVAFTQKRLRPAWGGRLAEILSAPLAEHEFLNLRTYVRVNGEAAIFFLAEWIPNALARLIGPAMYGLPYRLGRLAYHADGETSSGCVRTTGEPFRFEGDHHAAATDERIAFLIERYCAFTFRHGVLRRFRIDHEPWPIEQLALRELKLGFLSEAVPWLSEAQLVAADFSEGVADVKIAPPRLVRRRDGRMRVLPLKAEQL